MGRYQKAPDIVIPPSQPAVKSIQTGFLSTNSTTLGGSGTEDSRFRDVTISSVDPNKCVCDVFGGNGSNLIQGFAKTLSSADNTGLITCRIIDATTLRISMPWSLAGTTVSARWRVVEYA